MFLWYESIRTSVGKLQIKEQTVSYFKSADSSLKLLATLSADGIDW